ncbi:MAG TPA: nucleotidyltransferase domain-containing protein [Burkholderiaceae bacterium]|nr:nucleotidyltransferase domain-containing protein [Burkholderiaceae bacterium]
MDGVEGLPASQGRSGNRGELTLCRRQKQDIRSDGFNCGLKAEWSSSRRFAGADSSGIDRKRNFMGARLPIDPDRLAELCRRHHIYKLSLFGSQLKGTARPDSDIDLLVEFQPDAKVSLLDMARIEIELSELLEGRRVDLRTARDLSRYFRNEVVRTAEPQYVAG